MAYFSLPPSLAAAFTAAANKVGAATKPSIPTPASVVAPRPPTHGGTASPRASLSDFKPARLDSDASDASTAVSIGSASTGSLRGTPASSSSLSSLSSSLVSLTDAASQDCAATIRDWHPAFLSPLNARRRVIEEQNGIHPGRYQPLADQLTMLLTDHSQRESATHPGLAHQFCVDTHRQRATINGMVTATADKSLLEAAQSKLLEVSGGDPKLAFLASALSTQSLVALAMGELDAGHLPVEVHSGGEKYSLAGGSLATQMNTKLSLFEVTKARDGGVLVRGTVHMKKIDGYLPKGADESLALNPDASHGEVSIAVHVSPGPDYSMRVAKLASTLQVTVA